MTINRILYALVIFILGIFFILYVDKLSLILFIFSIILPILSFIACYISRKSLSFKLSASQYSISKDTPITLNVTVKNKSILPIANIVLLFEYFNSLDGKIQKMTVTIPASPKSTTDFSFNIISKYCGVVSVKLFDTKIYDNLKLFTLRKRHQQECSILIMPKYHDIPMIVENLSTEIIESDTFSKTKSGDDCSEVFDIREYQEGDKLNRVHWKLSSKAEQTYVKEYSLPISNSVVIIPEMVNTSSKKLISTMDTITELLLSISQKLNYNEVSHRIALFQNDNMTFHTITDNDQTYDIVNQMIHHGISKIDRPYAFKYFQAINEIPSYSHVIYITNVLDINVLSNLEDFNATKKTVFYISTKSIDEKYLNYDGVQVVQVVNNMISQSIGEFIV